MSADDEIVAIVRDAGDPEEREEAAGELVEIACTLDGTDADALAGRLRAIFDALERPHVTVVATVLGTVRVFDTRGDGLFCELTFGPYQPVDADGLVCAPPENGWHVSEPDGIDLRAVAWVGGDL